MKKLTEKLIFIYVVKKNRVWNGKAVVSVAQAHWTNHLFLEVSMCMFNDMNVP